jgi:hypothetical protein
MTCCSVRTRRILAAASILLAAACGNSTPTPTAIDRAVITLSTNPNPILAVVSSRTGTAFSVAYKVVITETAGQGGQVQAVNSTLYDDVTGVVVGIVNYDSADLKVFVGADRVEANGTLEVPIQIDYVIPSDPTLKAARLQVLVNLKDDKGNAITSSLLVKVE